MIEKCRNVDYYDGATPDHVASDEWGIHVDVMSNGAIPFFFTDQLVNYDIGPAIFSVKEGIYHTDLSRTIWNYEDQHGIMKFNKTDAAHIRIWRDENIITMWTGDDIADTRRTLTDFVSAIKSGKFTCFGFESPEHYWENPKCAIDNAAGRRIIDSIDWDNLYFYWEASEEDPDSNRGYTRYMYRQPLMEFCRGKEDIKIEDEKAKLFHLMTPQEKAEALKNNDELRKEREYYAREGDRAWARKRGSRMDPAQYHLLRYMDENRRPKKKIRLTEADIHHMVLRCVEKILGR